MPRIFSTACLLALIVLAFLAENRLFGRLKRWQVLLPVLCAALVGTALLLGWLHEASDAVRALLETAYPGLRRISGGTMGVWTIMQGWLAPLTIGKVGYLNQCELQGPLSLLFPLAAIGLLRFGELKKSLLGWAVVFFSVWVYVYQLIGFPDWLAAVTFWNRCNPPRCAAALSLAQVIFLALIFSRLPERFLPEKSWWNAGRLTRVLSILFCMLLCNPTVRPLWDGLKAVYPNPVIAVGMLIIMAVFALLCYLLLTKSRWFIPAFLLVNLLPAACFNPVCLAPVKVVNKLEPLVRQTPDLKYGGRFLFLGKKNFHAVAAFAAGAKVLNGYFLYPDRQLHQLLFGREPDPRKSFRMSNYDLVPVHDAALFRAVDEGAEHIRIELDAENFDFSALPADFAGASGAERPYLEKNPSLELVRRGTELDLYRIVR